MYWKDNEEDLYDYEFNDAPGFGGWDWDQSETAKKARWVQSGHDLADYEED